MDFSHLSSFHFFSRVAVVAFCVPKAMEKYIALYKTLCFCRTEIWMVEISMFEISQCHKNPILLKYEGR